MRDNKWLDAGELGLHSILYNFDDSNSSIASLRSYTKDTTVYNLTVDNDHTYFVGTSGVLGHNAGCTRNPPTERTWHHLFGGDFRRTAKVPTGFHHAPFGMLPQDVTKFIRLPHKARKGLYYAKISRSGIEKAKQTTMYPDDWSQRRIKTVINRAYYKSLLDSHSQPEVELSRILGEEYKGIFLRFKYENNDLVSVFPILR